MVKETGQVVAEQVKAGAGPAGPERREGERSEPDRSGGPAGPEAPGGAGSARLAAAPDPEVPEKAARRHFTAAYKLRILKLADTLSATKGQVAAMLRREGLYSSHLTKWREQREAGALGALAPKKRGRKPVEKNPLAKRVAEVEAQNRRLTKKLEHAELIIDAQKKLAALLQSPPTNSESSGSDE
jgi:transposase-like protein